VTVAPEEASSLATGGIVVGRGWAVMLVALMTTAEPELGDGSEGEN